MEKKKSKDTYSWGGTAFLFSKNMSQWLAPYIGYTIGFSKFFREYIWYIIYISVWIIIFTIQNKKYKFSEEEFKWGFGGLILGSGMMILYSIYDNFLPPVEAISQIDTIVTSENKDTLYSNIIYEKALDNNELIPPADQEYYGYLFPKDKLKNLKTINLDTWIKTASNIEKNITSDTNILAPFGSLESTAITHNKIIMVVMVTFIGILVNWERRIFTRMIPWILIILFFEILTVAIRFQAVTVLQLNNSMFISKKIHQLVSSWSMSLMLLFIGFYHTFK